MDKYRVSFTRKELIVLRDRLIPVKIVDYDLETFSTLRNLYGRLCRLIVKSERG